MLKLKKITENLEKFNLFFEYLKQDNETETYLLFEFHDVCFFTLKKIIDGDFSQNIILTGNDGSCMYWSLEIKKDKCKLNIDTISGGCSSYFKFSNLYLIKKLNKHFNVKYT